MKTKEKIRLALFAVPVATGILACLAGCSHNTGAVTLGTRVNLGFDPQSATANIRYEDGLNLTDISRENSCWDLEIDSVNGVSKSNGSIKGVKRIRRDLGPQITGYLVDLAAKDPETAREYVRAIRFYWQYKAQAPAKEEAGEKSPETSSPAVRKPTPPAASATR